MSKPKPKGKKNPVHKKPALQKTQKNGKVKKTDTAPKVVGAWSKVKIAGNLVTDDGGGLEGLIGLEVLENYEPSVVATSGKRTYSAEDLDDDFALLTKAELKKRRLEHAEKDKERKQKKDAAIKLKNTPGAFVRLIQQNEDGASEKDGSKEEESEESSNDEEDEPMEVDEDEAFEDDDDEELEFESESDEEHEDSQDAEVLSTDDLTEWKALGVHDLILKALAEKKFKQPTQIQLLTIPAAIMGRKDILGAAETGSGKTLAFGIPILNGIIALKENGEDALPIRKVAKPKPVEVEPPAESLSKKKKKQQLGKKERDNWTPPPEELAFAPMEESSGKQQKKEPPNSPLYALVLTPTRELCVQVKDHLVTAAKYTGINVAAIFGGLAHVKQERVLRKCPEIVVATPGRLWELIQDGNEHLNKLADIKYLVIDETDRMVEKGHFEELKMLLGQLNSDADKKAQRQNFVFSATLTLTHDLPNYIKGKKQKQPQQTAAQKVHSLIEHLGISKPKVVDITQSSGTAARLTECRIVCDLAQKDWYLYYFLQRHQGRTIVFCNSIDCVKRLGQLFGLLGCVPRCLHAHMNQRQRLKNLERFTASDSGLLIATDVAARGLDIPNVKHVIHYQVPRTGENYVHRSGRTARAQEEGITVLMMEPAEVKTYMNLCRTLKRSNDIPLFPVSEKHLKAVKARVDLAREVDLLDLKSRRSSAEVGWLKKSAQEMDILVDDMSDFSEAELYDSDDGGERYREKHELRQKRDNLTKLLAQPLFPKGFSYKYPTSTGQMAIPLMDLESNKANAVEVMKSAIEDYRMDKKRRNKKIKD